MISASQYAQLNSASADDKMFGRAKKKITKLVVGIENDEMDYEGGFADTYTGLKERELGGGINWFSNAKRGAKVKAEKAETTKAKNPYSAVEFVWKKPKTGEGIKTGTKKSLSGVKIDPNFAIHQFDLLKELLEEKFVWLSMYDEAEDKNDVATYGDKDHDAKCLELLGRKTAVWNVRPLPERKAGTWGFELTKSERSAAFGGKGKTSYKSKYEELVALINSAGNLEEVKEFLARKEAEKTPPATPTPEPEPVAPEPEPVAPEPKAPEPKKEEPKKEEQKKEEQKKTTPVKKGPGRPKKEPSAEGESYPVKKKDGKKKKSPKKDGLKMKIEPEVKEEDKDGASSA
jgi:hypothetical protein